MTRTFARFALLLVVSLALLSPGNVVAGPPEKISGKLVFDEVADGLRKYRKAKEPVSRIRWLEKLAPTRDPRVALALVEASESMTGRRALWPARGLLADYFVRGTQFESGSLISVSEWWIANKADLVRRAKELPQ